MRWIQRPGSVGITGCVPSEYALWQTRLHATRLVLSAEDAAAVEALIAELANRPVGPASPFADFERQDEAAAISGLGLILTEHEFGADRLEGVWAKAARLEQGGTAGARPFALYPGLARAFPDRRDELAQRMRQGLVSADPEVADEALFGLYRWMEAAQFFDGVPGVPLDLVAEVGATIAARRRGVAARALEIGRWIFDEGPDTAEPMKRPS